MWSWLRRLAPLRRMSNARPPAGSDVSLIESEQRRRLVEGRAAQHERIIQNSLDVIRRNKDAPDS